MDPITIVQAAAILILGSWNGLREYTDYRRRKMEGEHGLKSNPTRCAEHAEKINQLVIDVQRIKDHLGIV